ncbi:MAG: hypothetical protein Q8L64_06520 [bacterium]|nr:hypothetical protein [bacterium]
MRFTQILMVLSVIAALLIMPARVDAQVPPLLPFGGWLITPIPCTCSLTTWNWYAPLYLAASVPVTGPMTYVPYATVPFANFLVIVPATPHKGAYIPGVPACWVGFPPFCVPLPNIGVIGFMGTGLPGGK